MVGKENIPEDVARVLRQEAGFGCCVCGNPIFEYHHIIPYIDDDPHFRPEDMMILCPNHHRECRDNKKNPSLSIEEQRKYKKNPYNIKKGNMAGLLKTSDNQIKLGKTICILEKHSKLSIIDGNKGSPFYFSTGEIGNLEITGKFYSKERQLLASLDKNGFVTKTPFPWDIQFKRQWVKIWQKKRNIFLEINAYKSPIEIRADIWWKNRHIRIYKNKFDITDN